MDQEKYYMKDGKLMSDRRNGKDRRVDKRGGRRASDSQGPRYLSGKNSRPEAQDISTVSKIITYFDYETGLAQCGGNYNTYEKALRSFLERTETILDCIHDPHRIDFDVYQSLVRLVRLDFEKITALRLASMAQILEKAAKNRQGAVIDEDHDIFIALSYLLCIEVRQMITELTAQTNMGVIAASS